MRKPDPSGCRMNELGGILRERGRTPTFSNWLRTRFAWLVQSECHDELRRGKACGWLRSRVDALVKSATRDPMAGLRANRLNCCVGASRPSVSDDSTMDLQQRSWQSSQSSGGQFACRRWRRCSLVRTAGANAPCLNLYWIVSRHIPNAMLLKPFRAVWGVYSSAAKTQDPARKECCTCWLLR